MLLKNLAASIATSKSTQELEVGWRTFGLRAQGIHLLIFIFNSSIKAWVYGTQVFVLPPKKKMVPVFV